MRFDVTNPARSECRSCTGSTLKMREGPRCERPSFFIRSNSDDRVSRREISRAYYRRNSNRIRALRQIAIRIAQESGNDYLPELEAVAADEMSTLFEHPPKPGALRVGAILSSTFRFLGSVRSGEIFYVFARLDPYERVEPTGKDRAVDGQPPRAGTPKRNGPITRARRVITP